MKNTDLSKSIVRGAPGRTCNCNIWSLFLQDTSTVVWRHYDSDPRYSYIEIWEPKPVDWKILLLEDTTSTIYYIQLPKIKENVCDSITIINPNKQNIGEFIVDFRKAINIVDAKNTKWIYTYGNVSNEDRYTKGFVPDTIVACIFSQSTNPVTACGSKWVWDGLAWDKQKEVPEEQFKSTLNILKK